MVPTAKPPPRHFPVALLRAARAGLDTWAARDVSGAPWRHATDPWSALVSSVLVNGPVDDGTVSLVLWQLPTPADLTPHSIEESRLPAGVRRALTRLLPAVEAWKDQPEPGDDGQAWWEYATLLPAELERFACLALDSQVILTTQPAVRVAARVTGRPVDKVDKRTDGRLALAEIIGGGSKAPARMAAVAALGRGICTIEEPDCKACPLALLCRAATF